MKRIGVLTSGGDAPGMNAAVRAVTRRAIHAGLEVMGIRRGYVGLLQDEMEPLTLGSVADIIHRGGTVLLTGRTEAFKRPEMQARAVELLRQRGIDGLVVIGGDGSFRGALALAERGVPTVGIPATIDNDIWGTEYAIGFDTCTNTVMEALDRVRDTATSHERTFVIEVMGRDSGQIALAAGLAGGAESILLPEAPVDLKVVVERLRRGWERNKRHSLIIVAEGAGRGFAVAEYIREQTGQETRVTVLGHLQRGGSPSALDRRIASRMGAAAVEALLAGQSGVMVGVKGETVVTLPLREVLGHRRPIDREAYELAAILAI